MFSGEKRLIGSGLMNFREQVIQTVTTTLTENLNCLKMVAFPKSGSSEMFELSEQEKELKTFITELSDSVSEWQKSVDSTETLTEA